MKIFNIKDRKNSLIHLLSEDKFIWILYDLSKKKDNKNVLFGKTIENKQILNIIFEIINKNEKKCSINSFI